MTPLFSFMTRERRLQLAYLLGAVLGLWGLASWVMFRNYDSAHGNTDYLVEQISLQRELLTNQQKHYVLLDSTYRAIVAYQPQVRAVFVEVDIEGQLADIRSLSGRTGGGVRFRSFAQMASFYKMMYTDKKILWSKHVNTDLFRKQADECEIGFQRDQAPVLSANPAPPPASPRPFAR